LSFFNNSSYEFNDQGHILLNCVRTIKNLGVKDAAIWGKVFEIVASHSNKMIHKSLIDAFVNLCQIPEPIHSSAFEKILDQIEHRLEFCTFYELSIILDGMLSFLSNVSEKKRAQEYQSLFKRIQELINKVINLENKKDRSLTMKDYSGFLFSNCKINEIKEKFGSVFETKEILADLERYWKSIEKKAGSVQAQPLDDVKKLGEFLISFNRYITPERFPLSFKKVFIQSAVNTYDALYQDVASWDTLEGLIRLLDVNQKTIQDEKIDCTISPKAYERFLDLALGDHRKLSILEVRKKDV
jgi:hypothetical protein